jgi:predicted transcriptional regulator
MENIVAKEVRERRKKLGITQKQLAQEAGYTAVYLREIEIGRKKPTEKLIRAIQAALSTLESRCSVKSDNVMQSGDGGRLAARIESMRPDQRQRMIAIMLAKIPADQIPAIYEAFISMNEAPNDSGSQKIRTTTAS